MRQRLAYGINMSHIYKCHMNKFHIFNKCHIFNQTLANTIYNSEQKKKEKNTVYSLCWYFKMIFVVRIIFFMTMMQIINLGEITDDDDDVSEWRALWPK